jgi:hypothetical protein
VVEKEVSVTHRHRDQRKTGHFPANTRESRSSHQEEMGGTIEKIVPVTKEVQELKGNKSLSC